jgi:O-antigen/teichoic acid export membrane protein
MKSILLRNSLVGIVQYVANALLLAVTVPVFIRLLGTEAYGVFSLLMIIGNLNSFANLGLTSGLIKFLSEQGKSDESDKDILVACVVLFGVTSIVVVVGLIFRTFVITSVLAVPSALVETASQFYVCLLIANIFLLVGQVFVAVLDVQQKIHLTSLLQFGYNVLYWCGTMIVLLLGFSLPAVGVVALLAAIGWGGSVAVVALRQWGVLNVAGIVKDFRRLLRKQLVYGSQVYIGGLLSFGFEPLTKILVAQYIGMSEVGYFDIALRIRTQVWGMMNRMFYPLYPMIAKIEDPALIRFVVHDVEQKALFFILPLIAIVVFTMNPLIEIWLHANAAVISTSAIFILASFLVGSTVVTPNYHYLLVKGHAAKTIVLHFCNVLFNVILFFLTYQHLGYYAVVVSTSGAILISFAVSLHYQRVLLDSKLIETRGQALRLAILFGSSFTVAFITNEAIPLQWVKLIAIPTVVALVTVGIFRTMRFFSHEDLDRYLDRTSTLHTLGTRLLIRV